MVMICYWSLPTCTRRHPVDVVCLVPTIVLVELVPVLSPQWREQPRANGDRERCRQMRAVLSNPSRSLHHLIDKAR